MYYLKKDQENRDALSYIKDVLQSHEQLRDSKQKDLINLSLSKEDPFISFTELEDEIEILNIQISSILYVYDYTKLMISLSKKLSDNNQTQS